MAPDKVLHKLRKVMLEKGGGSGGNAGGRTGGRDGAARRNTPAPWRRAAGAWRCGGEHEGVAARTLPLNAVLRFDVVGAVADGRSAQSSTTVPACLSVIYM